MYPALHLYPLNDTFVPKQINLSPASSRNRVKIGRYSNAKSVPSPLNGFFDSKVLSRAHAEVWSENGKVYIKDVKSSNGTFVNGTRLSPESQESDAYELHSDDVVDFGIDILTDDNKEILHQRVACRVFLVITAEDALKLRNDFTSMYRGGVLGGPLGSTGVCPGAEGGLRRGKPGYNFDHIIFRLQNELQKSKEVGTELSSLSATMQDIHQTIGGGQPPNLRPGYQHLVPSGGEGEAAKDGAREYNVDAGTLASLETKLSGAHALLTDHVDRIKSLESTLAEYQGMKDEVSALKQQVDSGKRGDSSLFALGLPEGVRQVQDDDADDATSIASVETAVPGDASREAKSANESEDDGATAAAAATAPRPVLLRELETLAARVRQLEEHGGERTKAAPTTGDSEWREAFEHRWRDQIKLWETELHRAMAQRDTAEKRSHNAVAETHEIQRRSLSNPATVRFIESAIIAFLIGLMVSRHFDGNILTSILWSLLVAGGCHLSMSAIHTIADMFPSHAIPVPG